MTHRQELFIQEYLNSLNATQSAIRAGYSPKTAYSQGQRLLKNVEVLQAINKVMNERKSTLIATREQRQEFWTSVMLDTDTAMKDRLKASELLGKSEGDFTDKVQANISGMTLADLVMEDYEWKTH